LFVRFVVRGIILVIDGTKMREYVMKEYAIDTEKTKGMSKKFMKVLKMYCICQNEPVLCSSSSTGVYQIGVSKKTWQRLNRVVLDNYGDSNMLIYAGSEVGMSNLDRFLKCCN